MENLNKGTFLLDLLNIGIIILDKKGIPLFVNKFFDLYFNKNPLDNKLFLNSLHEIFKSCATFNENNKCSKGFWVEKKILGARDKIFWFTFNLKKIYLNSKEYVFIIVNDITKEKYQKIELETLNKNLEEYNYFLSHDLKGPIDTIESLTQLYIESIENMQEIKNNSKSLVYLKYILNTTKRTRELINSLLEYNSIRKFKEKDDIDIKNLVEEARDNILYLKYKKDVNYKILLNFKGSTKVKGYKTHLRSLFQNLLSNAIKFSDYKRKNIIVFTFEKLSNGFTVTISDKGVGIRKEDMPNTFNIFKRFNMSIEGSGVGLAYCKKIVDLHKGEIKVQSTLNEGTTFDIFIPE